MEKVYRRREVETLTGLSKTSIYRAIQSGKLSRPHRLTDGGRAVGWKESQLQEWLDSLEQSEGVTA